LPEDHNGGESVRPQRRTPKPLGWDIILTILTALTLMAFGVLCLFGMFHYKFHSTDSSWSIAAYQQMMNRLATPLVLLLILWLVLCIPKRLFSRKVLYGYSAAILAAAAVAWGLSGFVTALGLALVLSSLLQTVILVLVIAGARLRFSRRGLPVRIGSSLIHLGFVLLCVDLVLLQGSPWHIPLFWVGTIFMTVGSIITFYFPRWKREVGQGQGPGQSTTVSS
jgi:hypothetical protein